MPGFSFSILFLLFSLSAFTAEIPTENPPHLSSENYILILSSYQYNHPYATTIAKKIQSQLEQTNPALIFRTVYASLDIQKTMLASRLNMQKAFSQARLTPTILLPKILVLIGDESWMLYHIMNLRGKWENIPVVLCGVHNKILRDYASFFPDYTCTDSLMQPLSQSVPPLQVTGILSDDVHQNMTTFIHHIFPDLREIIYISNGTYSDEYAWQKEKQTLSLSLPKVKLTYFNSSVVCQDSLCHYINQCSPDSAALVFNSQPSFLASLQLPAFSLRDEGPLNNQTIGGYYTTSDQYAQQTARLIMRIYNGTPLNELPFQYVQNHHFYLNAQAPYLPQSHWQEKDLPGLSYYNVPSPFLLRHIRMITLILLLTSISVTGYMIYFRTRKYRHHLQALLRKYKALHEKFRIIYDNMPIALAIFDKRGTLLHQNPTARKLQQSWSWDTHQKFNLFDDLFTKQQLQQKIHQHLNIDLILPLYQGKYYQRSSGVNEEECEFFRLVVRYIPDETNNSDNILVMLIDNTAIYREKIANKRIRNMFNFAMNKAAIGVAEYNLCTHTRITTDSWRKHLNLEGKSVYSPAATFQYVNEEDQTAILQFLTNAYQGKSQEFTREITVHQDDDSIHYLRERIKVMDYQPENNQIWVTELNQNIDQEKQTAAEMQIAIQKAQEAERLKNTFIANMSHEIRSPLNSIVGFSKLMIDNTDIQVRSEMIHYIEESNDLLLRLINDIIDLSKMESGSISFTFSETDINALFQDITVINQIKANQKNLTITCHCPLQQLDVLTDKIRIKQVISNFISNAIKFTVQGSIRLGYRKDNDQLYVYVSDTGIGIPAPQRCNIFERFARANKAYQGYGLGLSIAKAVIEGLHGEIGVESEEGKGSTFWFRIPVRTIRQSGIFTDSSKEICFQPSPHLSPHLLVIEKKEDHFTLLQFMLKDVFRITHARNGKEAVRLYRENHYDLILMDIRILQEDGDAVIHDIRQQSPHIPIIATTAYDLSKYEVRTLSNEFNAYLAKPLKKSLLLDTINYWLNHEN